MSHNNNNENNQIPIISLPPPPSEFPIPPSEAQTTLPGESEEADFQEEMQEEGNSKKKEHEFKFADKVIIGGKTVLEISDDKIFHEEEKVRRSTRWTSPKIKRSK